MPSSIVTWQPSKLYLWKQIRNFSTLFSILAGGVLFFFLPFTLWAVAALAGAFAMALIAIYCEKTENKGLLKTIEDQKEAAQDHLIEKVISATITLC